MNEHPLSLSLYSLFSILYTIRIRVLQYNTPKIKNHGIPLDVIERVQQDATDFFDLSLHEKQRVAGAAFGLGYMGQGTENVAATLGAGADTTTTTTTTTTLRDQKESLNLTLPVRSEIWPSDPPHLVSSCQTYYVAVSHLAAQLMQIFAVALQLEETYFDTKINQAYTTLRLLNYPALEEEESNAATAAAAAAADATVDLPPTCRTAAHTDYGTLTILWSPDSRGLQAQDARTQDWIEVIAPCDQFIINIGDLMMQWTNDRWRSTVHRVLVHPETRGQRRMSIPFFHNPNPDAIIACLPGCCRDSSSSDTNTTTTNITNTTTNTTNQHTQPPKYAPILAQAHLEMKVSKALGQEQTMEL